MEFEKVINGMQDLKCYAKDNYVPIIRDKSAKFLYDFINKNQYKDILEIGTAIGYSGSIIMSAGAEKLTTIDINEDYLKLAKETFSRFDYLKSIEILHGDAFDYINKFKSIGRQFDMIFLDGAKGQYINYLPVLACILKKDGVIFADNVLLHGMVESNEIIPHKKRTMVVNLRKYLDAVNHEPFETNLLHLEDGIAITKIKGDNND